MPLTIVRAPSPAARRRGRRRSAGAAVRRRSGCPAGATPSAPGVRRQDTSIGVPRVSAAPASCSIARVAGPTMLGSSCAGRGDRCRASIPGARRSRRARRTRGAAARRPWRSPGCRRSPGAARSLVLVEDLPVGLQMSTVRCHRRQEHFAAVDVVAARIDGARAAVGILDLRLRVQIDGARRQPTGNVAGRSTSLATLPPSSFAIAS
jgi:hypothetical protein